MAGDKHFAIAVVGGGIAGLTLAIALHERGVPVTIYEQAPAFGEIGAGVSFSPNAIQAMKLCHKGIYDAFEKVCTRNVWPSKQKVWFDYLDGHSPARERGRGEQGAEFTISNTLGQNGVHRAHFLEAMVELVPNDIAQFGKRLSSIIEDDAGKLVMNFDDGTKARADVIIGCDGIKSRVRQQMFGADHPCTNPSFTYKIAYRGLVPMEEAIEAVGKERAENACMYMGPDGHMLTFPINHGQTLNIVAFRTIAEDWPDFQKLTRRARREDALRDYEGYGSSVINLLKLTQEDLDVWAIFDLGDNPVPTFAQKRMCLLGDAAHATSPHHGAGAGFCIEDSAMMAELLADDAVRSAGDLEAVLATYDVHRRERGQWLVQSSRWIGDCYEWRAEGIGKDFAKIEAEINERNGIIANIDMRRMCNDAKEDLRVRLKQAQMR